MKNTFSIKKIPLLPMLLAFASGIFLQNYLNISLQNVLIGLSVFIVLYYSVLLLPVQLAFKLKYVRECLLLLAFAASGSLALYKNNVINDKIFISEFPDAKAFLVKLNEPLTAKPKSYKSTATVEKVLDNNRWKPAHGKLFIYFQKTGSVQNLSIGSQIVFTKKPDLITNPGNPGEFDYAGYCHRKGIYFQQFLSAEDFVLLREKHAETFSQIINHSREKLNKILEENINNPEAASVAKALLLGNRSDLDKTVIRSFNDAGITRLLSASGMHLLIIAAFFDRLLLPLKKLKRGNILHSLFVILFIWFFVFIEGATPSVLRAAIVSTAYLSSRVFNRKHHSLNSLVLSAFILLIINPYNLFDAGFLLTYASVLSIALFNRPIYLLLNPRNKIMKLFWGIIAISFSAQILALPFILYFFRSFPVLFLFGNAVAMPVSAIIIYMEILLIAVSPIHFISEFVGKIIQAFILFLDKTVHAISSIPFAIVENSYINILQTVILFTAMLGIYFFVKMRLKNGLTLFVAGVLSCIIIGISKYVNQVHQHKIIAYNVGKHFVIDVIDGHSFQSFSDTSFDKNSDEYVYVLKPSRDYFNVHPEKKIRSLKADFPSVNFMHKQLFFLNQRTEKSAGNFSNADAVVISKNSYINFAELKRQFSKPFFVFTNENSLWKIERWKSNCDSLHLHFHSIPEQGAFVMNL